MERVNLSWFPLATDGLAHDNKVSWEYNNPTYVPSTMQNPQLVKAQIQNVGGSTEYTTLCAIDDTGLLGSNPLKIKIWDSSTGTWSAGSTTNSYTVTSSFDLFIDLTSDTVPRDAYLCFGGTHLEDVPKSLRYFKISLSNANLNSYDYFNLDNGTGKNWFVGFPYVQRKTDDTTGRMCYLELSSNGILSQHTINPVTTPVYVSSNSNPPPLQYAIIEKNEDYSSVVARVESLEADVDTLKQQMHNVQTQLTELNKILSATSTFFVSR